MKRLLLPLFSMVTICIQAQWVNIPDSNFGKWLTTSYPSCMQGNQQIGFMMDTSCALIVNETILSCPNESIVNLYGVQYFKSLTNVYCPLNELTSISILPSTITSLICYSNQLTQLPTLPPSLNYLDCGNNQITYMPALPNSLVNLFCSVNQLTGFSNIPSSLTYLDCSSNQLTSIPTLPNALTDLNCSYNQLTNLPTLPNSLIYLECSFNQIGSLPTLPNSLANLICLNNLLTNLPTLPDSLAQLSCGNNVFSSLPTLPSKLRSLDCQNDSLTFLPSLPNTLVDLWCSSNQFSSLPVLPESLKNLYCDYDHLTVLPLLPNSLETLSCTSNQLSSIPDLPKKLSYFYCDGNQLSTLPALPISINSLNCSNNPNISCIPSHLSNMDYLYFGNTNITCMPNRFSCQNFTINPNTLPLCDLLSGCSFYYNIAGNVHQKSDSSCSQDSITPGSGLSNVKMLLSKNGQTAQQTYAYNLGEYSFDTDSNSTYDVSIDTSDLPLKVSCPASFSRNVVLTNVDSIELNENFGLECKGVDVGVYSIQSRFRPGRSTDVNILGGDIIKQFYNATCGNTISGTVTTTFTGPVTYVGPAMGSLSPTSVSGNTLNYSVSDFSSLSASAFNIALATDTHAVIGTAVCITVTVSTATDINAANNSLTQCFPVVNSYDPNAKEVYPKQITSNGGWLTYTVHFQNTGNDTAYDVVVRDTLSSFVDANSFQFLASSHDKKIIQIKGNAVAFTFPNINLVDSATNPAGSQGWFQFKVKTKSTLPLLTNINNTAFIYFDFNPAIKTNTATTVVEPLGINEAKTNSVLQLYPNPNNGSFTLHAPNKMGETWQLTDVLGRSVAQGLVEKEYVFIQLTDSKAGVYIFTCAGQQIRLIIE